METLQLSLTWVRSDEVVVDATVEVSGPRRRVRRLVYGVAGVMGAPLRRAITVRPGAVREAV